jgi:glycosyltransferase involved in cell wall biosynthesis
MYERALRLLIDRCVCAGSVSLLGGVERSSLLAHFANADVFVCLSEHEGFGVPLVEAMAMDVPIVAFDAGAVAETLAGAGRLLSDKAPSTVVAAVAEVLQPATRQELIRRGRSRAAALSSPASADRTPNRLVDWLGV